MYGQQNIGNPLYEPAGSDAVFNSVYDRFVSGGRGGGGRTQSENDGDCRLVPLKG